VGHGAQVFFFFSSMATWTVMISNSFLIKENHGERWRNTLPDGVLERRENGHQKWNAPSL
jgi:hypothetical protein